MKAAAHQCGSPPASLLSPALTTPSSLKPRGAGPDRERWSAPPRALWPRASSGATWRPSAMALAPEGTGASHLPPRLTWDSGPSSREGGLSPGRRSVAASMSPVTGWPPSAPSGPTPSVVLGRPPSSPGPSGAVTPALLPVLPLVAPARDVTTWTPNLSTTQRQPSKPLRSRMLGDRGGLVCLDRDQIRRRGRALPCVQPPPARAVRQGSALPLPRSACDD